MAKNIGKNPLIKKSTAPPKIPTKKLVWNIKFVAPEFPEPTDKIFNPAKCLARIYAVGILPNI